jgi:arabinogalactan oligomer/maltooligosaccharide transport system substrate-binding protein
MTGCSKAAAAALIAVVSVAVTACSPHRDVNETAGASDGAAASNSASASDVASASAEAAKPEKLVVWANDDANQLKAVEQISEAYTKKTGIEVEVTPVSGAEQVQKLALAAPSGKGPDLFYQPQDRLGDVVAQGLAEPVSMDGAEADGYSDAAIEAVRYDGKTYGYPISVETYALYYNKDLASSPPATFEETASATKSLTDPGADRYGFLIVPDFYYAIPFIANYGGYIFGGEPGSYDVSDIGLNNEGAIAGLKAYQQFMSRTSIPQTLTTDIMDTLFTEGKAAMIVDGLWSLKTFEEKLGDKLGTAPLPSVNGKSSPSFVGVKSWFVSSYSSSKAWAMDLAAFLTNDENAGIYHDVTGEIPARTAALEQIGDPLYKGFVDQIASGIPMPNVPEMTSVWEMDNAVDFILKGDDVTSVLDETVEKIRQQIKASGGSE